jgi:hypothetical protein
MEKGPGASHRGPFSETKEREPGQRGMPDGRRSRAPSPGKLMRLRRNIVHFASAHFSAEKSLVIK